MTGVVQNQDSYMKGRIGQRAYTDRFPASWPAAMAEWTRPDRPTRWRRSTPTAARTRREILVAMGTIADTAIAVVDHLRDQGRPVGCVAVTSFRPFPAAELARSAPPRTRPSASSSGPTSPWPLAPPLTREIRSALYEAAAEGVMVPRVLSFSAGLGSRDVAAGDLVAVFDRLAQHGDPPAMHAVLGIRHPLALERVPVDLRPAGAWSLRGHSIGGFGSVTTNKLVATLAGELFDKHVQAYPRYGSEKKGLPTTYYLTIADEPIRLHAELDQVEFVPLHDVSAFGLGDPLAGLTDGGDLFIQSTLDRPAGDLGVDPGRGPCGARRAPDPRDGTRHGRARRAHTHRDRSSGSGCRASPSSACSSGVAPFAARAGLDREALMSAVGARLGRFFGKRGGRVVAANLAVIEAAYDGLIDVSAALGLPTGHRPGPDRPAALDETYEPEPQGAVR